ncbi:DUF1648 domain-containing protein [Sphaerisporangium corydalis]|uniref:DUF1648 domain-containing protein n=1 Tax=Sphaerisporangium corydalis TaxID=1441875 RepID=A0ABV9EPT9_9ACTN|nr:DUF1648 domain-containing protein [Sphaerisporangium corydalis]
MSHPSRSLLVAGAWTATVTGILVAVPLLLRDRLPEPLAAHWGPSGRPDRSLPFWASFSLSLAVWALPVAIAVCAHLRWNALRHRAHRRTLGIVLGAGAAFAVGTQAITLAANLDRPGWHEAGPLGWRAFLLVFAAAAAGGALGRAAGGPGPDEPLVREPVVPQAGMRLRPDRRTVWVSSASNGWVTGTGVACLVAAVALAVAGGIVAAGVALVAAGVLAVAGLVVLWVSTAGVRVGDGGLVIAFGPFRRPRRTLPLATLQSARAEERRPSEVGGWGIRGLAGSVTIMIRAGECLVVRDLSGGELAVSVDDAAHGAALLNGLIARRAPVS